MKKGFTLIELIATIVILSVILIIAIPIVLNAIATAKKGAFESDAKIVAKQLEYKLFYDENLDISTINKENFKEIVGLDDQNYSEISMVYVDNKPYITLIGQNKWNGLKACGTVKEMKAVDVNDEETCRSFYGPWSAWQETPIEETDDIEVETGTFYNYQVAEYDWGEWYDLGPDYAYKNNNIIPIYNIGDKEQRNLYRYRDTSWRWYTDRDVYYPDDTTQADGTYSSTAPDSTYTTKDTEQTSYTSWSSWTTTNPPNQSYREEETRTVNMLGAITTCRHSTDTSCSGCGTANNMPPTPYTLSYSYVKWHCVPSTYSCAPPYDYKYDSLPSCPSGQTAQYSTFYVYQRILGSTTEYRYRDQQWKWYTKKNYYYPDDTTQANGTYSSTAPSGYPTKDTSSPVVSNWTYTDTTAPTSETYREIQIKIQERQWEQKWSIEVINEYKSEEDFATEIRSIFDISVEELQNRSDVNIITKTMYRYREKN